MAAPIKTPRMMGQPVKRMEDPRLITGAGQYLDDLTSPACSTWPSSGARTATPGSTASTPRAR